MHVALGLAVAAPSERQQRILTRYVLVHADAAQRYLRAWHGELDSQVDTRGRAARARTALKRLRREYAHHKDVRDKLASRRQAAAAQRAADLRRTVAHFGADAGALPRPVARAVRELTPAPRPAPAGS